MSCGPQIRWWRPATTKTCSTTRRNGRPASRPARPAPPLPSLRRGAPTQALRACRRNRGRDAWAASRSRRRLQSRNTCLPAPASPSRRRARSALSDPRATGRSRTRWPACARSGPAARSRAIPRARPTPTRPCGLQPRGWHSPTSAHRQRQRPPSACRTTGTATGRRRNWSWPVCDPGAIKGQ